MATGSGHPVRSRRWLAALPLAIVALMLSGCGDDEVPELTFEEQLVELEGRSLTPAEVAERVDVGQTLCQMDDRILDQLWQELTDDQLDFQDLVVAELCPERAILYAGHTGRFVTEEAQQSGVRTSTTRPTSTTSTTGSSTTPPTTTSVGATGTSGDDTDPSASSTSITGSTSTSTVDPGSTPTTTATTVTTSTTRPTTTTTSATSST